MSSYRRANPNPATVSWSAGRPFVVRPDPARAGDDPWDDGGPHPDSLVPDTSEAVWSGTTLPDPTDALDAIWGTDSHRPDPRITTDALNAIWTADTRRPDPRITTDALNAIWTADTRRSGPSDAAGPDGRLLSPGTVGHRRRTRPHPHRPADTAARRTPVRQSRLAVVCRGVGGGLVGLVALAVAWLVLVPLRYEPRVAYRDAVATNLDAAVAETLTTDHVLAVATWVGYLATTVVLGGVVFERFVARRPVRLRLGWAILLGLVAAAAALPLRAAEVSGDGLAAIAGPEVLRLVATSAFGGAIALRAAGLLLLGASLNGRRPAGRPRGVGRIAGGAALVASYLVIGHPQASDPAMVEVIALVVHLLAVATWFGGVAVLATELRTRGGGGRRLPAGAINRFSRIAEVMVVLVLASGLVLAEGQGALNTAPWRTGYGLALTAKLSFVAIVLAIGGYNRVRVVPAIAEHDGAAARRHLRTTCVVEALVISMGVLLMTAAMTSGGF